MLELGKKSKTYHIDLSRLINSSDIDKVFVKGQNSLYLQNLIKRREEIFFNAMKISTQF